jgi:hypothetical protein
VTGSHRHGPVDPQQGRVLPFSADRTQARPPPRFPGFERLSFSVRTCWDYAWRESAVTNGERDPVKSGVVRISLAAPLEVDFGPPGDVAMFEVVCSAKSGEVPPWWPQWRYVGVKDGAFFAAAELEDGELGATLLFDPTSGEIHPQGFMGRFTRRAPSVAMGTISNAFLSDPAVVVEERPSGRGGEGASPMEICEGELHESRAREYWLPGKGFGGWSLRANSIYAGGGYVDCLEVAVDVGLTSATL